MPPGHKAADLKTRLMTSVAFDPPRGCWTWTKHVMESGYGQMGIGSRLDGSRRLAPAHRVSYEVFVGPIPNGLEVDHLCFNRRCINPAHLEAVTPTENKRRSSAVTNSVASRKGRTHCPKGHPYTKENTLMKKNGTARQCRTCTVESTRRWRAGLTPLQVAD